MSFTTIYPTDEFIYENTDFEGQRNNSYAFGTFNKVIFTGDFEGCEFIHCIFLDCVFNFPDFTNSKFKGCKFRNLIANFSSESSVFDTCELENSRISSDLEMLQEGYSDARTKAGADESERNRVLDKRNKHVSSSFIGLFLTDCQFSSPYIITPEEFTVNFFGDTNLGSLKLDAPSRLFEIRFDKNVKVKAAKWLKLPSYKELRKNNVKAYVKPNKVSRIRMIFRRSKRLLAKLITMGKINVEYCENEHDMWTHFLGFTGESYFAIANHYYEIKDYESYSYYFYNSKKLLNLPLETKRRVKSNLVDLVCGYGEKWEKGLYFSLASIFIFAFFYMSGLEVNSDYSINYVMTFDVDLLNISYWTRFIKDYWNCLYFSMMTFTTVGYGNMQAISLISQILSFIQMFLGIIIMTITTGSLLRKILR